MPTYGEFRDASVLITGGGSGIGAALTEGFALQGAKVAFIDIDTRASRALVEGLKPRCAHPPLFIQADLRDVKAVRKAVTTAANAHGPVTTLVNNAAWDDRRELEAVTEDYWDNTIAINLRPFFFAIQAVTPGMRAAGGGGIINFTSTCFMLNVGGFPAYSAAKAGVIGLTKGLAGKLGRYNIRINAIAPGWVMTERQRRLWVTKPALDAKIAQQCLKRPMQPDDIVGSCLFLASAAAGMVTAQVLIVDGGVL